MVRKTTWILILTLLCQPLSTLGASAALPRPLVLVWQGDHSPACQKLIGRFLEELRSLASGRKIALDMPGGEKPLPETPERRLPLSCEAEQNVLRIGEPDAILRMTYLTKAGGFDASDWVPFQERFLRAEADEIALAPATASPSTDSTTIPAPAQAPTPDQAAVSPLSSEAAVPASRPIYARWWFWAAAAAAGAGAFAATQLFKSDPRGISVEIH